jgi:hypothetical protein
MKKILTFLLVMMCLQTMAQMPTQIPRGQIIKQQEAMKKIAENKAAIDKVLNATLSKITFSALGSNGKRPYFEWFKDRQVILDGDLESKFYFSMVNMPETLENEAVIWNVPVKGSNQYTYVDYKTFLNNGVTVKINLTNRQSRAEGFEFLSNFTVGFTFSDGTLVSLPLQDPFTQGYWKSKGEVHVIKSFPGSAFPDPANPLVLPPVK